jgi:hypothetical protein
MDQYWMELIKQVPALVVLVWIVYKFLDHLKSIIADHRNDQNQHIVSFREMAEEQQQHLSRSSAAIDRNTETLGKNNYILGQALRHFEDK